MSWRIDGRFMRVVVRESHVSKWSQSRIRPALECWNPEIPTMLESRLDLSCPDWLASGVNLIGLNLLVAVAVVGDAPVGCCA